MFRKILVANRGEIANRIFLACHELGIPAVAVYAKPDTDAAWYRTATEAYPLPGTTAAETYLNQELIFKIAHQCGADAIHPGYGFLSENAAFADACTTQKITFIGPTVEAIDVMGSKANSRALAKAAGVPIVPGVDGAQKTGAELITAANDIGYPVLIKASAGGGGKGMRVVWSEDELLTAVQAARQEAQSAFGDAHILIEKFFTEIHHVEIQVIGDQHGNLRHLYERECSIQRRHQKIIEESPAPVIQQESLRQAIAEAAVSLARHVNYLNAGTVEFIVDDHNNFYFLEMNTRLQVEHPITELVTGIDLAVWQIRVAAGEALPWQQADINQRGHAIECRLYAEDPAQNFLPSIGEIIYYQRPTGPGIRVDDGIATHSQVTPYYDPMLAKVVTWGRDRTEAIRKMIGALKNTIILGVTTNIPYLLAILEEPHFKNGHTSTNYLETHFADWQPHPTLTQEDWIAAAAAELLQNGRTGTGKTAVVPTTSPQRDPWDTIVSWRNV